MVQAVEKGTGKIVYARASLRNADDVPAADAANDPGCEDYVGCVAHARLDALIPLSPLSTEANEPELVVQEHLQSLWGDPIVFDPERLPELIELTVAERDFLVDKDSRGEITTVSDALRLRYFKSLVPYYRQHLKRLQETTGEDG